MKAILLCLAILVTLTGCGTTVTGRKVILSTRCPVHGDWLVRISGYTFSRGICADPAWDYVRFMAEAEARLPHTTPWSFSATRGRELTRPTTATVCPRCDSEFGRQFADYEKLSEAEKEARWNHYLRHASDRDKQKVRQKSQHRMPTPLAVNGLKAPQVTASAQFP